MSNDFENFGYGSDDSTENDVIDFDSDGDMQSGGEPDEKVGGMNPKKIGLIVAGIVFVVVIGLLLVNRLSVTTKTDEPAKTDETTQVEEQTKSPEKDDATQGIAEEDKPVSAEAENTAQPEVTQKPESDPADTYNKIRNESEVRSPEFKGDFSTGALVTDRFILKNGSQYQFVIELSVSKGDSVTNLFYYATKDAYDSVKLGDALKVSYTGDGVGGIAVKTITKP